MKGKLWVQVGERRPELLLDCKKFPFMYGFVPSFHLAATTYFGGFFFGRDDGRTGQGVPYTTQTDRPM